MKKSNTPSESKTVRISISIPRQEAEELDRIIREGPHASRSAFLTDLVREKALESRSRCGKQPVAGAITLVYDHHIRNLQARLTKLQHDWESAIVSVMHVHLTHHSCLEVLVVKGAADSLRKLADELAAFRGVQHAKLTISNTGKPV